MYEEITDVFKLDDNFGSLRELVKKSSPPMIPYLGAYLSDLTFKDVDPNFTDDGLVNFGKMRFASTLRK
jgi:hypothetical protein